MPQLTVALISDLFAEERPETAERRLADRLREAGSMGARLAVLPELPLNAWRAASRDPVEADAEPPGGWRQTVMSRAAASAGVGVLGGAIVRDPVSGLRRNVALLFDARGGLLLRYAKLHLPEEPGFWETSHYVPGDEPPGLAEYAGLRVGAQICSDVNRPEGSHMLGAMGAEVILCPRATESGTWARWKMVLRANAVTSTAYVLTVNRPHPESGVPLGGPSMAAGPDGDVLLETTDAVAVVTLDQDVVARARRAYPGYMKTRAGLYAQGWQGVARDQTKEDSQP